MRKLNFDKQQLILYGVLSIKIYYYASFNCLQFPRTTRSGLLTKRVKMIRANLHISKCPWRAWCRWRWRRPSGPLTVIENCQKHFCLFLGAARRWTTRQSVGRKYAAKIRPIEWTQNAGRELAVVRANGSRLTWSLPRPRRPVLRAQPAQK